MPGDRRRSRWRKGGWTRGTRTSKTRPGRRAGTMARQVRWIVCAESSTPEPKSGAQCVSSARWDLRGGPPARAVPTAIMLDVDPKDLLEVAAADDQQPVQALGPDRAHPALGVGVRRGCPHRRAEHLTTLRAEHLVETAAELGVPVVDKEAHLPAPLAQHQQKVAGLLGDPAAV